MLVWLLIPDVVALEFGDLLDDGSAWGQLWLNIIGFCGMSLVEPCYVAAGFALYLNRRTGLEAWDLELGFRQMAARWAGPGRTVARLAVLVVGLSLLTAPGMSRADHDELSLCEQRQGPRSRTGPIA